MSPSAKQAVRLPSVDQILRSDEGAVLAATHGHAVTVSAVRHVLAVAREVTMRDGCPVPATGELIRRIRAVVEGAAAPRLRRVFNLTGTVLHTNLGRAVLPEAAITAAVSAMRYPAALEYDVASGRRGERDDLVRDIVRELTGAEDAVIVNNNASAVLLVLNTLAAGREAIVSRGELIEIGGAFRLPDIMKRAGCHLIEVGTTNRTHPRDYEEAIGPDTGLVMKAHTSNYVIEGFTAAVSPSVLAPIARKRGVPFVNDLGSGALVDLTRYGLAPETTVRQSLAEGADIVTFSGDKLLGGPQIGIVAGKAEFIRRIARNPMKRALRVDKIRLAVLEATLKLYRDPDRLAETLPTIRYFARKRDEIAEVAQRLLPKISVAAGGAYEVRVIDCGSQVGSGAAPVDALPSAGLGMTALGKRGAGGRLEALAAAFRALAIPVIGRIHDDTFILDLRCLDDEAAFVSQLDKLVVSEVGGGSAS